MCDHYGPSFGDFDTTAETANGILGPITASCAVDMYGMTADDLRKLATDALAAAEWLEANS